jgi:hypothetical protein
MKKLKRLIAILCVSLSLTMTAPAQFNYCVLTTEAHSGRTDSSGGHHDYKNKSGLGSYHYHHGYPAHLHTNGVCPYNNASGSTSNASSASSSASSSVAASTVSNTASSSSGSSNSSSSSNSSAPIKQTVIITDTAYDNVAFNASYYANRYSDLYSAYGDDAKSLYQHFITTGIYEGRQSSE